MEIYNGTYCVYIHTNKIDGKMYVGQTIYGNKPNKRWQNGMGYRAQIYFWRAIEKYGWDNFDHEVIASNLTKEEADNFERLLIEKLHTNDNRFGYNLTNGGEGVLGYHHSAESIQKQKDTMQKYFANPKYIQKMREVAPKRDIYQFTLDGVFIKSYESSMDAERQTGLNSGAISKCALEKCYYVGEYIFTFAEDVNLISERVNKYRNRQIQRKECVVQLSLDGDYIAEWKNAYTAGKQLHIEYKNINAVCHNKKQSAGGCRWMFLSDYNKLIQTTT